MYAYLTKDPSGLVQLWNNKPIWYEPEGHPELGYFYAWKQGKKGTDNEIGIDISDNNYLSSLVTPETSPVLIKGVIENAMDETCKYIIL